MIHFSIFFFKNGVLMLYQPVFQLFQVVLVAQATLSLPEKTFKNTENKHLMGIT